MRILRHGVLTFATAALAGPLIDLATWPRSHFEAVTSFEASRFVYQLVLYLWPALLLHAGETSEQFFTPSLLYPICANLVLFALLGLAATITARRRSLMIVIYAIVCALLLRFGLWAFSLGQMMWLALIVAMALYAVPFWLVARAAVRLQPLGRA